MASFVGDFELRFSVDGVVCFASFVFELSFEHETIPISKMMRTKKDFFISNLVLWFLISEF